MRSLSVRRAGHRANTDRGRRCPTPLHLRPPAGTPARPSSRLRVSHSPSPCFSVPGGDVRHPPGKSGGLMRIRACVPCSRSRRTFSSGYDFAPTHSSSVSAPDSRPCGVSSPIPSRVTPTGSCTGFTPRTERWPRAWPCNSRGHSTCLVQTRGRRWRVHLGRRDSGPGNGHPREGGRTRWARTGRHSPGEGGVVASGGLRGLATREP